MWFQGGLCSVYVQEVERTVSVPSSNLEPIIPEKNDKVGVVTRCLIFLLLSGVITRYERLADRTKKYCVGV